jgi:hypothetical protein
MPSDTSGDEQHRLQIDTKHDVDEKPPRRPHTPYKYPPPLAPPESRMAGLDESMAFGEVQLNGLLILRVIMNHQHSHPLLVRLLSASPESAQDAPVWAHILCELHRQTHGRRRGRTRSRMCHM